MTIGIPALSVVTDRRRWSISQPRGYKRAHTATLERVGESFWDFSSARQPAERSLP